MFEERDLFCILLLFFLQILMNVFWGFICNNAIIRKYAQLLCDNPYVIFYETVYKSNTNFNCFNAICFLHSERDKSEEVFHGIKCMFAQTQFRIKLKGNFYSNSQMIAMTFLTLLKCVASANVMSLKNLYFLRILIQIAWF